MGVGFVQTRRDLLEKNFFGAWIAGTQVLQAAQIGNAITLQIHRFYRVGLGHGFYAPIQQHRKHPILLWVAAQAEAWLSMSVKGSHQKRGCLLKADLCRWGYPLHIQPRSSSYTQIR